MLPIHFAPLQGFTESAYRQAHYKFAPGIETYYTPFLRLEKGKVRPKDFRDLEADCQHSPETDTPLPYHLVPQVIVRDKDELETLAKTVAALGFREIDINMGCPFPMQTKSGRGAGLLANEDKVQGILDTIKRCSLEDSMQFSIKMRIGLSTPEEGIKLLPLINEAPLAHVTIHPRLGIQQYKGALDFDTFDYFYRNCKHKLLFNGDLTGLDQIKYIENRYPDLAGVMIGRGLLANPILASQYAGFSCGSAIETLLKIHREILANYSKRLQGESQILDKLRPFWTYADLPKKVRKRIEKSKKLDEYLKTLDDLA